MSVPGAFLDRDGVLIEDCGYPHLDEHLRLMPGAAAAVKRLNDLGYRTVIVTNQSGVARGLFDEERMHAFNALLLKRLADEGARIDASTPAPSTPRRRSRAIATPTIRTASPTPACCCAPSPSTTSIRPAPSWWATSPATWKRRGERA